MNKLLVFFLFLFSGCTILSMIVDGGGGAATTTLTTSINYQVTTLNVTSTADFTLSTDYIFLDDEKIIYGGKTNTTFTSCARGTDDTQAAYHPAGTKVYNEGSNIFSKALGFNPSASASSVNILWALITTVVGLVKVIMKALVWDYSFLTGNLVILKYVFLYPLSAGFIVTLAIVMRQLIPIPWPFGK